MPEAKHYLNRLKQALGIEANDEAVRITRKGAWDRLSTAETQAEELKTLAKTREEFDKLIDSVIVFLEEHPELANLNISQTNFFQNEKVAKTPKKDYDRGPQALLMLMQQDEEKNFIYSKKDVIEKSGLNLNTQDMHAIVFRFRENITKLANKYPEANSISDLLTIRINKPNWSFRSDFEAGLYEYIISNYEDYSPQEFIENILQRSQDEQYEETEAETNIDSLILQIKPIHEIVLCNSLLREDVLEQLFGHIKEVDDIRNNLNKSREKAAEERKKGKNNLEIPIKTTEAVEAREFVRSMIGQLMNEKSKHEGLGKIKNFYAIKLLYFMSDEFIGDSKRAAELIKIIFPDRTYKIDNKGLFEK